jgi:ribosome-binding protein aMBF1 (putative translation factor)
MSRLPVVEIEGKRYVLVPEAEYKEKLGAARDVVARLPAADSKGYRPAVAFIEASIARDIVRERRAAGMSQQQLAQAAGVRQETLSRIESGKHSPTVRTVRKIEAALKKVTGKGRRRSAMQGMG